MVECCDSDVSSLDCSTTDSDEPPTDRSGGNSMNPSQPKVHYVEVEAEKGDDGMSDNYSPYRSSSNSVKRRRKGEKGPPIYSEHYSEQAHSSEQALAERAAESRGSRE